MFQTGKKSYRHVSNLLWRNPSDLDLAGPWLTGERERGRGWNHSIAFLRMCFMLSYLSVWLHQSRNFPVTWLYTLTVFYKTMLKEPGRGRCCLLLWIYCLGSAFSWPSGMATFTRKYWDFFHPEDQQFNHSVRSPHLDGLLQWFGHLYLQAACTRRRAVSPLASVKFDGQVFEAFPTA